MTNTYNLKSNLIKLSAVCLMAIAAVYLSPKALASCEPNYGGGENCIFTGSFTIEKWVRLEDDDTWRDEVVIDLNDDDEKDKEIEFRIKVTARLTDVKGIDPDDIDFDDLKMKDSWPDELKLLDDEDELTQEWDNMKPGETKTFYLSAKIESDQKNRDGSFEKCVINKAKLYYKDDLQGSDDAVVCYKKVEEGDVLGISTELPETGGGLVPVLLGLSVTAAGLVLGKRNS